MSTASEYIDEEKSFDEEDMERISLGLYMGGRNSKGERNGRGWAILPNGDQYDGQYSKGRRHGTGLYVFQDGSRYFGQYRCGIRSGRGLFIYPDGSFYEGTWRKNLKHGKGRYSYANGDTYCGSWYRNQRHGVGIYTCKNVNGCLSFTGTWHEGIRVGPFQLNFGSEDKITTLHGSWSILYPKGPCVFSFNNRYLLTGYFQSAGSDAGRKAGLKVQDNFAEDISDLEETQVTKLDMWSTEPTVWCAQDMCTYDISLLPQEPVPLPLSDSDISVCSLSTTTTKASIKKPLGTAEVEEEAELECYTCECSSTGVESARKNCSPAGNPCDIDNCC